MLQDGGVMSNGCLEWRQPLVDQCDDLVESPIDEFLRRDVAFCDQLHVVAHHLDVDFEFVHSGPEATHALGEAIDLLFDSIDPIGETIDLLFDPIDPIGETINLLFDPNKSVFSVRHRALPVRGRR